MLFKQNNAFRNTDPLNYLVSLLTRIVECVMQTIPLVSEGGGTPVNPCHQSSFKICVRLIYYFL